MKEEKPCTPLTLIVWGKCCRIWPLVQGERVGTCGICGAVPVPYAEPAYDPAECEQCTIYGHWCGEYCTDEECYCWKDGDE